MFKLLKKVQALLIGHATPPRAAEAKQKEPVKTAVKSKKHADRPPREEENAFRPPEKSRGERGKGKGKKRAVKNRDAADGAAVSAPPLSAVVRPPRPEQLEAVEPSEGRMRFLDLPLPEAVQFGIQALGFKYCTPIQQAALPALMAGRDLGGKAQTGTGKTAAFLLTAFAHMASHPLPEQRPGQPRVLVLAPTRELAIQIHKDAEEVGCYADFNNVVVFGGMDHQKQRDTLRVPIDILVGTPGRIIDYSRSGAMDLSRVELLVIDEADRMLDMGFIPDVKRIVAQLPAKENRQTMLFSATLEPSILRLAQSFLHDPMMVESEPEHVVGTSIEQTFYSVAGAEKLAMLLYIIKNEPFDRMLIFGNRKDKNLDLQDALTRCGITVELLSGDIPQQKRLRILEDFRSGKVKLVIATDVAARGIHVDDVSIVVNYDLPERSEDYVHRIGRTGRAGQTGKSISFICEYGAYYIPEIEKFVGETFKSQLPTEEMVTVPEEFRSKLRGRAGRRTWRR